MISDLGVMHFSDKLDEFIVGHSSSIPSFYVDNIDLSYSDNKLQTYVEAKEKLLQYSKLKQESIDEWLGSDRSAKTWFNNLFNPSGRRPGYSYAFGQDPLYRGFAVTMDILGYFGTDFISGISIPDAAFDYSDNNFIYALHHSSKNKMSIALNDQILTMPQFGLHQVYESMSEVQQNILKNGIIRLLQIGATWPEFMVDINAPGLLGNTGSLYSGTGVNQWITLEDFLNIFPNTLKFTFIYGGPTYSVPLLQAWEVVFGYSKTDGKGFDERIFDLNFKLQTFRDEMKKGNNPYSGLIEKHFPSVEERFLENAELFAKQFIRLIDNNLFTGLYTDKDLAYRWHIYLLKNIFKI